MPGQPPRWTQNEKKLLRVCRDVCNHFKLDFEPTIPILLAHHGVERTGNAVDNALRRYPSPEEVEEDIEECLQMVCETASRLELIPHNFSMDKVAGSSSGVDKLGRTETARGSNEVLEVRRSKRRCTTLEPAYDVPQEGRKAIISIEPPRTRIANIHGDVAHTAEYAEAGIATSERDVGGNTSRTVHSNRSKAQPRKHAPLHYNELQYLNLQEKVQELEQQVRKLQSSGHPSLREQSRRREFEGEAVRTISAKSASHHRKKVELEGKDVQYTRREDKIRIMQLEKRIERLNKHNEERTKEKEDYYESQIRDTTIDNARLRADLRTLTESKLIDRNRNGRFPTRYNQEDLHAKWNASIPRLINIFAESYEAVPIALPAIQSLINFESLLRMATALSATPTEASRMGEYRMGTSSQPKNYSLVLVCFMTRVLRWCFETSFHIDGPQGMKVQEIWESLATYGGLEVVRKTDMLATVQKVKNKHFRDNEVPEMAKRQMAIFMQEFYGYLPVDDDMFVEKMERWLAEVMTMKLELLISHLHHKIAFIPPGTPFDRIWMTAESEYGGGVEIKENCQYRVCLCLSPALIGDVEETSWSDKTSPELLPQNFRDALLESRNFFPEEAGQWKGWPGSKLVSPATVIVEEVPSNEADATMTEGSSNSAFVSSDEYSE